MTADCGPLKCCASKPAPRASSPSVRSTTPTISSRPNRGTFRPCVTTMPMMICDVFSCTQQMLDEISDRSSLCRCVLPEACCTQRWLKYVTKRSFRTTARSGPSVLPQCATPRVGTSWSAPAVSRRVHCKRSHVHSSSHSGEHSAPSQNSWPHPLPSWPNA
jgi:hypothetical protein